MMLRGAVLILASLCLLAAAVGVTQDAALWPMLLSAALFVAGTLFERFYYRGNAAPGGNWQPTAEKFVDDESGLLVTVWFDPATGARRYVEAGEAPPARH